MQFCANNALKIASAVLFAIASLAERSERQLR